MIYEDLCKSTFETPILSNKIIKLNELSTGELTQIRDSISLSNSLTFFGKFEKDKDYPEGSIVINDEGRLLIKRNKWFEIISEPNLSDQY